MELGRPEMQMQATRVLKIAKVKFKPSQGKKEITQFLSDRSHINRSNYPLKNLSEIEWTCVTLCEGIFLNEPTQERALWHCVTWDANSVDLSSTTLAAIKIQSKFKTFRWGIRVLFSSAKIGDTTTEPVHDKRTNSTMTTNLIINNNNIIIDVSSTMPGVLLGIIHSNPKRLPHMTIKYN